MKQTGHFSFFLITAAFVSAWASALLCGLTTFHVFTLLLFAGLFYFYRHFFFWEKSVSTSRPEKITSAIISFLYTFFCLCGNYEGILQGLQNRLFQTVHLSVAAIGLFLLFYTLVLSFFIKSDTYIKESSDPGPDSVSVSKNRLPLWSFFFCLLCFLPYFLMNFPAVMTVDSLNQYGQIIGALPYSNHHPWVHTLLIRFWYSLGIALTGSETTGLACYTFFQMCVMALIVSYVISTFIKLRFNNKICLAALVFFALMPYNGLYAVTMWKDILFSGMALLFTTVLLRFLVFMKFPAKDCLLYLISGIGMCLLRSNGWYAFLLTFPFILYVFCRQWKTVLTLNLLVLFAVLLVKIPVMNAFHIAQPDFVESLSIPIQQAARVYAEKLPADTEDTKLWNRIMDTSKLPEIYYPYCSDNVKSLIRDKDPAYLSAHKTDYAKLWFRFGLKHPGAYFRAYVDATKGYWYPDVENLIGSNERIAENEYGLTASPVISGHLPAKGREILFKLHNIIPLYGLLWSLGALFWAAILLLGKAVTRKNKTVLLVFLPNMAVMATLFLATPVYNEFRYAYSLILALPVFAATAFLPEIKSEEKRQSA